MSIKYMSNKLKMTDEGNMKKFSFLRLVTV